MPKKKPAANDHPPASNSLVTDPAGADVGTDTNEPDSMTDLTAEERATLLLVQALQYHDLTDADLFTSHIDPETGTAIIITVDARKLFYPPKV